MHIEAPPRRRRQLIGLTPLIDVVFILLIFFMLASSFSNWQSISLAVPGNGQTDTADSDTLVIRLLEGGGLQVDGEVADIDTLMPRFRTVFDAEPERAVVVRPDDTVPLQRVVDVVERLNAAGGSRVTINREAR